MRKQIVATLALFALTLSSTPVRAERHPEHMLALGWQTENSDAIVIARPGLLEVDGPLGAPELRLAVTRVLRGDVAPGDELRVLHSPAGRADVETPTPWRSGASHLVFLRAVDVPDGVAQRYRPVTGSFGYRLIEEGRPGAEFPRIVEQHAATLDEDGGVARPDELRSLLVRLTEHADDGIALSAALDLVRHTELHVSLSDAERLAILSQFRDRTGPARRVLALAAAATRHVEVAPTLVDALLEPSAVHDRIAIGEALRRLDDVRSTPLVRQRISEADAAQRASLLNALGAFGAGDAVPVARLALADAAPEVRVEAAHALGRIARTVRADEPGGAVDGREDLLRLLALPDLTRNEQRAAVWCLLQLEDPKAVAAAQRLARDDPREDVRRFAERYLQRPRLSLILDD